MEAILEFSIFLLLPLIAVAIYFFFKCLQFLDQAASSYKKMVIRQEATLKLLVDIRDNTKKYDLRALAAEEEIALAKSKPTPRFTYFQGILSPVKDAKSINEHVSEPMPEEEQNVVVEDEEAKKQATKEMIAAKYESSKQPIVAELKDTFETNNKREILKGLSQLDYYKLTELAANPGQLTETGRVVCRALVDKIQLLY